MKKCRFTDSQILAILKEAEDGVKVPDLCRKLCPRDTSCRHENIAGKAFVLDTGKLASY